MPVTARTSRTLQQTLGDEPAEDVINWMQKMEADTSRISDRIDFQFGQAAAQIDIKFQQHEARVDARFAEFHRIISAEINARFNDLLKWSFVFWAGAVGAIAALAGIFR